MQSVKDEKIDLDVLPLLESLSINLQLFVSLKGGHTLGNLKVLELIGVNDYHSTQEDFQVLKHSFQNIKFTGLKFLRLEKCLISISALKIIDKGAQNLSELVIDTKLLADLEEHIANFMEQPSVFQNLKIFRLNGDLINRY